MAWICCTCTLSNAAAAAAVGRIRGCFLVGYLQAVSSVCALQQVTYFVGQTVFTFFPQLTIPDYHVQFIFFIISYFDNETYCMCVT